MGHPPPTSYERMGDLEYYDEIEHFRHRNEEERHRVEAEEHEERRREGREEQRRALQLHQEQRRAARRQQEQNQSNGIPREAERYQVEFRPSNGGVMTTFQVNPLYRNLQQEQAREHDLQQQSLLQTLEARIREVERTQQEIGQILIARAADAFRESGPYSARSEQERGFFGQFERHCRRVRVAGSVQGSLEDAVAARATELADRREAVRFGEAARERRVDFGGMIMTPTGSSRRPDDVPLEYPWARPVGEWSSPPPLTRRSRQQDMEALEALRAAVNSGGAELDAARVALSSPPQNRRLLSTQELAVMAESPYQSPRYIPGERLFPAPNINEQRQPLLNFYRLPSGRGWEATGQNQLRWTGRAAGRVGRRPRMTTTRRWPHTTETAAEDEVESSDA
ncbi:hypothetical protein B0T21DRAFT_396099 [Apiosordaria backusii]|uniref:Uncharacterized protein n=1 Tax=Apiosordaria backusii TaxID=314023 RepID=A0AA40AIN2_9PEZI|nr:hypothetical protein B0T21DRAFT_396099 [Apiosordaria backusii]